MVGFVTVISTRPTHDEQIFLSPDGNMDFPLYANQLIHELSDYELAEVVRSANLAWTGKVSWNNYIWNIPRLPRAGLFSGSKDPQDFERRSLHKFMLGLMWARWAALGDLSEEVRDHVPEWAVRERDTEGWERTVANRDSFVALRPVPRAW